MGRDARSVAHPTRSDPARSHLLVTPHSRLLPPYHACCAPILHSPLDPPPFLPPVSLCFPNRPSVRFLGPGGSVTDGRRAVKEMYEGFCVRHREGTKGLAPFRFRTLSSHRLGSTLFVRWRFTSAALAKAYTGADAYGTVGTKLVRVVSTFDVSELKYKGRRS